MRWKSDRISGWGRHIWADMQLSRASRLKSFKDTFAEAPAPAIGGLRSYGDPALNSDGKGHVMTRMDRFIAFDEAKGTVTAQAGITMIALISVTLDKGWAPSALPGTGFATLGGCIAMDVHGKDHRIAGSFSAQILEMTLMTPDGKSQTISREKKPDLFRATIGGLGQTGIIVDATLQLHSASKAVMVTKTKFDDLNECMALLEASDARFVVAWIDALAPAGQLGRGIMEASNYTDAPLPQKAGKPKSIPLTPPKLSMSYWPSRIFNALRLQWLRETGQSISSFMDVQYPLDKILDWNKLYGKDGFHQFQVSFAQDQSEIAIRSLLEAIQKYKAASPLVVIKRLGSESEALMGFTRDGYTLAVDFQHRSNTMPMLEELHKIAAKFDGRVYFAKDSSAKPDDIQESYPNLKNWQETVSQADPEKVMETDLIRRLELRP